jgi:diguanylate cyclase (GGDEF)-like protein/PAS domain S-box-containing protein
LKPIDDREQPRSQLAAAQAIAQLGSWEWDLATDRLQWSDELCRIYGLAPGEHPARLEGFLALVHPDDRGRVTAAIETAYRGGQRFSLKYRAVRPDGSVRVLQSVGEVVVDEGAQVLGMLGTAHDVTERELLDSELRRDNRYFELSRDLQVTSNFDGYFASVNPAVEHILGWSVEQFLARPFIDMVHPDDRAATLAEVAKLADGQVTVNFVNRYEASDGSYRWLEWNAIVLPEEGLMYASARDVTERKLIEAALAASEARTREILETAADAFVAIDAAGMIIDWNFAARATFGWTRDEALGRELADTIIPERYRAAHRQGLRRFLASGEPRILNKRLEFSALHRDRHEFPVELTIARRRTADSGSAFNAFLRDISDRRAAEEEIRQGRALSERLLRAQDAISRVFAQAQSSEEAMRELLAALGAAMDWQLGAWWSPTDDEVLRCRSVWHRGAPAEAFEAFSLQLELARGVALPGRVWASGQPEWTADLASDQSFPRANLAASAGLHASVCVPVLAGQAFRGAIEFFSTQNGEPDLATRQILGTIAEQIGGFTSVLDERAEAFAKLKRLALTDELTGLANRRSWQESLEREVARARRHGEPLWIAMLDLDHFKDFNDAHGHQAGDQLLRAVADAWSSQLRASDILARYGGEEFSLAFHASSLHLAAGVLARVRSSVPRRQTCSAGLAEFNGSETAQELVGRADAALYDAKAQGRDRIIVAAGS